MSYIGAKELKASDIRRFDVTGSTSATHTLTWSAPTEQSLIVTINGVKQHEDAYSVSGTTLTLTSALVSTDKLEVIGINDIGTTITPAEGSVTNDHISTSAAIATSKISGLATSATTDTTNASNISSGTLPVDRVPYVRGKNLIINGAMQVAQRNSTQTGITGAAQFVIDRMRTSFTLGTGAYTLNHSTDAPEGFANSYHIDVTTAMTLGGANDGCGMLQQFEGQNLQHLKKGTSNAEDLTLSFWIKSTKTGTYIVELYDNDNTRQIAKSYTVNSSDTWEKKELTFPGDTTGSLDNDNQSSLWVNFFFAAGTTYTSGTLNTSWASHVNANRAVGQVNALDSTSNNIYVTGIQLEVGDVATPFEHETYGETLAKCQRYYQSFGGGSTYDNYAGRSYGTGSAFWSVPLSVPLRTSPTLTFSGTLRLFGSSGFSDSTSLSVYGYDSGRGLITINSTAFSGLTDNRSYNASYIGGTAAVMKLDAEL